jgi:hypothetical protein
MGESRRLNACRTSADHRLSFEGVSNEEAASQGERLRPGPPRIITAWHLDHWSAWLEDTPQVAYGGDTPVVAVERPFSQWQNERFTSRGEPIYCYHVHTNDPGGEVLAIQYDPVLGTVSNVERTMYLPKADMPWRAGPFK